MSTFICWYVQCVHWNTALGIRQRVDCSCCFDTAVCNECLGQYFPSLWVSPRPVHNPPDHPRLILLIAWTEEERLTLHFQMIYLCGSSWNAPGKLPGTWCLGLTRTRFQWCWKMCGYSAGLVCRLFWWTGNRVWLCEVECLFCLQHLFEIPVVMATMLHRDNRSLCRIPDYNSIIAEEQERVQLTKMVVSNILVDVVGTPR